MSDETYYPSFTTPDFHHNLPNLITELILLSKYKELPPYCWRKGSSLQQEWGKTLVAVKASIKKLNITCEQVLLFWKKSKRKSFKAGDIGLVHYYLNRGELDDTLPIDQVLEYYRLIYQKSPEISNKNTGIIGYTEVGSQPETKGKGTFFQFKKKK